MKLSLRNLALATALFGTCAAFAQTTDRGQFAYNLKQAKETGNTYAISFDASGDAKSAVLLLSKEGSDEVIPVTLGEVKKGANKFSIDLEEYAPETTAKYTWSIEIHNYAIPADIVTDAQSVGGSRAGVVCMVDPTNEYYGMTVIARTKNGGFDVYNQQGEKVMDAVHKNNAAMGGTSANNSCPMRGVQRGTTAQFGCWGDAAIGVVAFDLANPTAAPYGVFEGSKNKDGLITNDAGEAVGSGTPCVAYAGEGEGTILFTFDEDAFNNNLAANPIGTAMTTSKAAENWGFGAEMANTNVGLVGTKNGLFFSQGRGNGFDPNVYSIGYISLEKKEIIWNATMEAEKYPDFIANANGGIDINPAGDLFAIATYTGVNVYKLSWDGEMPVLEPYKVIPSPHQKGLIYCALKFDAGNNIHVINQTTGYYQVIMGQEEGLTTTPAMADQAIQLASAVENVAYDAEEVAPVYYNINGVRVDGDLTPGVYVKVAGQKATKVVVK